ncbi:MAG: serine protease [Burkholderiales bacterium]
MRIRALLTGLTNEPARSWSLVLAAGIAIGVGFRIAPVAGAATPAQSALSLVVAVEARNAEGQVTGVGSGFFIHPDVVTVPAHVLRGAMQAHARVIGSSESLRVIGVTALDPSLGLALVKVSGICSLSLPLATPGAHDPDMDVYLLNRTSGKFGGLIKAKLVEAGGFMGVVPASLITPSTTGTPVIDNSGAVVGTIRPVFKDGLASQLVTAGGTSPKSLPVRSKEPAGIFCSRRLDNDFIPNRGWRNPFHGFGTSSDSPSWYCTIRSNFGTAEPYARTKISACSGAG